MIVVNVWRKKSISINVVSHFINNNKNIVSIVFTILFILIYYFIEHAIKLTLQYIKYYSTIQEKIFSGNL